MFAIDGGIFTSRQLRYLGQMRVREYLPSAVLSAPAPAQEGTAPFSDYQARIDALLGDREVTVLEIGAGAQSHITTRGPAHVVGLDISAKQLARNDRLDEKICADIQTYPLPASRYDVIVCWWLLEHLPDPQRVLDNCVQALRPNGLLIVAVPNPLSLKGLVTKYSPHWFHVLFYRYVHGDNNAGKNDCAPFPTYLESILKPDNIKQYARGRQLAIEHFALFEGGQQREFRAKAKVFDVLWRLLDALCTRLLADKISVTATDYIAILRKA